MQVIVCSIDSTTYRMCTTVTYRLDLMSIQYRYLALTLQLTTTLYFSFCSTSAHSSVQAQHPPHRPNIILFFSRTEVVVKLFFCCFIGFAHHPPLRTPPPGLEECKDRAERR